MAAVRLSDVFIPDVYGSYTAVNNPETSAFYQSGVIVNSELLNGIAKAGSKTVTVPFWNDIDPTIEPNYSNDDPADLAVPNKIGTGSMTGRKAWLNQGFSEMDLVSELVGASPMQHIRNRFGTYWTRQLERRLIATAQGIMADNIANDGGDMVIDISAASTATDPNAQKFGSDAFIDAAFTLGDQAENLKAIAVHSSIAARMTKNNELDSVRDSEGRILYRTYKEKAVIVDDALPVSGTGADRVYTSILFGSGAIGFGGVEGSAFALGEGVPKKATAITRQEEAGNGGGMETLWERKTWLMHPFGFSWVEEGAALAEMSPTLADLRLAAHWNRVVSRKQVPLAFIKSKA